MRVGREEFEALDLEVHSFLRGVPLNDVSAIDLPGGGPGRTLADVRALLGTEDLLHANAATRALFGLRFFLGRVFGWDRKARELFDESYVHRLSDEQRARSLLAPGARDLDFFIVYAFENEALSEIRNATVHAFSCTVLVPRGDGYRYYWAVYVAPVSRWTSRYMALIEPFRRFIVYPSILGHIARAWTSAYGRAAA
jgi:hypothetical protein